MKKDYYDDSEGYWQEKKEREESNGREILERWERENPHIPYGYYVPKYKEE
jgi:hypothetical protein